MLRACLRISVRALSYQREFTSGLVGAWRTSSRRHFGLHVDICFLDQIFSLCYLFSRHAPYIIFDFHRDERCKLHIRYRKRSASKKKQDRCQFVTISSSTQFFQLTMTMTKSSSRLQHSKFLALSFARLIEIHSNFLFRINCSSR